MFFLPFCLVLVVCLVLVLVGKTLVTIDQRNLFIKVFSLGLQMPSKKVLWGVFRGLNTFLEGIWSPRV